MSTAPPLPAPFPPESRLAGPGLVLLLFGLIYLSYLGIYLAGPLIVHVHAEPAKQALLKIAGGGFDIGWPALASVVIFGTTIIVKPVAAIGAIWLCELVVDPRGRRRNDLGLTWLAQTSFLFFGTLISVSLANIVALPTPWLSLNAQGAAAFSLAALPIYLLAILIADFFDYWTHRAQHAIPLLWHFHAVHHSHDLDALHNVAHPVELLVRLIFVAIPTGLIIGPSGDQVIVLAALFGIQGNIAHSRMPIHLGRWRFLVVDSRYHFVHHSRDPAHYNSNFAAVIPLYDWLFGTYRKPPHRPIEETGLHDRRPPETFWQCLTGRLPSR